MITTNFDHLAKGTHLAPVDRAVVEALLDQRFFYIDALKGHTVRIYDQVEQVTHKDWSVLIENFNPDLDLFFAPRLTFTYLVTGDRWTRDLHSGIFNPKQADRLINWAIKFIDKAQYESTQCEGQLSLFEEVA